jgi:hypothetical protein
MNTLEANAVADLHDLITKLEGLTSWNNFARSLVEQYNARGTLSFKQQDAAWAMIEKVEAKRASWNDAPRQGVAPQVSLDMSGISHLFETAARNLKHPAITFTLDGIDVRLSVAGPNAKLPGSINVTSPGSFEERVWYGRIVRGTWTPGRDAPAGLADVLVKFSGDPAASARTHGVTTGNCCFCRRDLTDGRSVSVGYGPICADHYGLPWGDEDVGLKPDEFANKHGLGDDWNI